MVVGLTKYEDIRQKRLEENKKRMDELKLPSLSNDLRKSAVKPSPAKKVKFTPNRRIDSFFEVRRSSRVAKKPAPNYKEGLSVEFCKLHLPKREAIMFLEDEDGEVYETKFLAPKTGLSAGWRGFALAHKLIDGDAVIFQLVEPTKFKVYIVRAIEPNSEN